MDLTKTTTPTIPLTSSFRSKKALVGWTVLACVAVSAAALFLVVMPQWNKVGPGREFDVAALESTLSSRERYLGQLKALRANYEKISQKDIALLARVLPTSKAVPELIQQIEAMGRESGLDVASVNISEVAEARVGTKQQLQQEVTKSAAAADKSIKQLNVQIQVNTNKYDRFKQFLNALQSNDRLLDIESYLFSSDQDVQTVTVKAYYLLSS